MKNYDVVIVGGGFAGLSAALLLGRSRRCVLVSDTEKTRNAVAQESHAFFTRDGTTPAELVRIGREQLRPYETVELYSVGVKAAKAHSKGFEITLDGETRIACRKLLLATGVVDEMPEIEGFKELWGKSIFHCPCCFAKAECCCCFGRMKIALRARVSPFAPCDDSRALQAAVNLTCFASTSGR